jgi:hypothetical protein
MGGISYIKVYREEITLIVPYYFFHSILYVAGVGGGGHSREKEEYSSRERERAQYRYLQICYFASFPRLFIFPCQPVLKWDGFNHHTSLQSRSHGDRG